MQVIRRCQVIVLLVTSESEKGNQQCKKNWERTVTQGKQVPTTSFECLVSVCSCILYTLQRLHPLTTSLALAQHPLMTAGLATVLLLLLHLVPHVVDALSSW